MVTNILKDRTSTFVTPNPDNDMRERAITGKFYQKHRFKKTEIDTKKYEPIRAIHIQKTISLGQPELVPGLKVWLKRMYFE